MVCLWVISVESGCGVSVGDYRGKWEWLVRGLVQWKVDVMCVGGFSGKWVQCVLE